MRAAFFLIAFCFFLAGCGGSKPREKGRLASPDSEFDAVLVEWPTNALSDFAYGLIIEPHGLTVPKDARGIAVGSRLSLQGMRWLDNYTIQVDYPEKSKIYSFYNIWYSPDTVEGERPKKVEVVLRRTPPDTTK